MSLYPTTTLDPATLAADPYPLNPGSMVVTTIDMTSIEMTQLDLQQMSDTQSFSLRAWISKLKGGDAIGGNYAVMRYNGFPIVVHVASQTPAEKTFPVLVEPGIYYLNILNLTNEGNMLGFDKTDLA